MDPKLKLQINEACRSVIDGRKKDFSNALAAKIETIVSDKVNSVKDYPYPISRAYEEMLEEPIIQLKHRALIKAFSATLKYTALILLSDYIANRGQIGDHDLDKFFVSSIARPSLGKWNELLRKYLFRYRGCKSELFMPELFEFYYKETSSKKLKSTRNTILINELIKSRNKYVHPDIFPKEVEAKAIYVYDKIILDELIEQMAFLKAYPLMAAPEGEELENGRRITSDALEKSKKRTSFFVKSQNTAGQMLNLGSFATKNLRCSGRHPVLLYETLMGAKAKYILCNEWQMLERKNVASLGYDPVDEIQQIFSVLALALKDDEEKQLESDAAALWAEVECDDISWESFYKLTHQMSEAAFVRLAKENTYDNDLYVDRTEVERDFNEFIRDDSRAMVVVADSGIGKTNLFCRWLQRLDPARNAVLLFFGRVHDGKTIESKIIECFKRYQDKEVSDFDQLMKSLAQTDAVLNDGKQFIILFDAVNEYGKPQELLEALIDFSERIHNHPRPWIKLIFSIRTFVWETLENKYLFDRDIFYYKSVNGCERPYVMLNRLSDDEAVTAFESYRSAYNLKTRASELGYAARSLLSNPLLLRFASEAYAGDSLPNPLFTNQIFEQYARRRIHKRDRVFLTFLTEAMWRLRTDALRFDYFDSDFDEKEELKLPPTNYVSADGKTLGLSQQLREYVFSDPVEERNVSYSCENKICCFYDRSISELDLVLENGDSSSDWDDRSWLCPHCHFKVVLEHQDFRSSYYRLRSENIIREIAVDKEVTVSGKKVLRKDPDSIRFVFDRMFEHLAGEFLSTTYRADFQEQALLTLQEMVGGVLDNHIFWGAIKKVIGDMLRDSEFDDSLWLGLLSSNPTNFAEVAEHNNKTEQIAKPGAVLTSKVDLALNQILISALEDYYHEDRHRVQRILDYVTQPSRTTDRATLIALKVVMGVLSREADQLDSSVEAKVLRRALRHSKAGLRFEAARILAALINRSESLPLQLLKEMQVRISAGMEGIKILKYALPKERKQLANELDSFFHLTLFIAGEHFDDKRLRDQVFSICMQVINTVYSNRLFITFKWHLTNLISTKISNAYWEKGALPCNYLEMHLSLQSDLKHTTNRIGDMFLSRKVPEDLMTVVKKMLSNENGLVTWYLYSILPIYAQQENQTQTILEVLQQLYDEGDGHPPTRYMVVQSLWIITTFSSASQISKALYVKYAKRLLGEYGGWVQFEHRIREDATIKRFLDESDSEGRKRAYWVTYLDEGKEHMLCRYDNSAMKGLAEYLIRNEQVSALDFSIDLMYSERWKNDVEFLLYTIATLGDIGERHSTVALRTLGRIIECKPGKSDTRQNWWHLTTHFRGRVSNVVSTLIESLLRIKSFHPQRVDTFIDRLPWDDYEMLKRVQSEQISPRSDIAVSYYGEYIYQKLFLNFHYMRDIFGLGVKQAGSMDNVDDFFKPYVRNFLEMIGEHAKFDQNSETQDS